MEFHFKISGDSLELIPVKEQVYTGNVNTYTCSCKFDEEWEGLEKFVVFSDGEECITDMVSADNIVIIPSAIISDGKKLLVGFFADSLGDGEFKRISTGFSEIKVQKGAYQEDLTAPEVPAPDLWEKLVNRNIPKIGENGNWQVWDINAREYHDSGVSAKPRMEEVKQSVANAMTEKVVVNAKSIELNDVSPLEHMVKVAIESKNLLDTKLLANKNFTVSDDRSTIEADTLWGWYSEKIHFDKPVIKNGDVITISVGEYTCDTDAKLQVHLQDEEKGISTYGANFTPDTRNGNVTVTAVIDVKDIFISVSGNNSKAVIKNLQIEYGDKATGYEPYTEDIESAVVREEFSEREYQIGEQAEVEIESVSPNMKITTDKGIISRVEYNKDIAKALDKAKEAVMELGTLTSNIGALQEIISKSGYIYHDWYYANGGAGPYSETLNKDEYGIFIVMSDGSTAEYTCSEQGDISIDSKTHVFINTLNSKGGLHTMWHLYAGDSLLSMSIKNRSSYPSSNITITNNTSSSGMNIIRIPMRSPK